MESLPFPFKKVESEVILYYPGPGNLMFGSENLFWVPNLDWDLDLDLDEALESILFYGFK